MRLSIHEILTNVTLASTHADRVAVLRKNDSPVLRQILQIGFHPEVVMLLPEGAPPFKRDDNLPIGMSDSNLYQEARRLYVFIKGATPVNNATKRETLFINMLEGLHPTEADLIIAMKDKTLDQRYLGLTAQIVFDAFPGIIPEPAKVIVNAPKIVPRGEVAKKQRPLEQPASTNTAKPEEKKPTNPKKLAAIEKAIAARKANAAARRAAKEAAANATATTPPVPTETPTSVQIASDDPAAIEEAIRMLQGGSQ